MGWTQVLKRALVRGSKTAVPPRDQSGIALFMVIAAMSILSILVTEFTYVAQISQKLAFDGLDQVKAHYLAKSALKISLLRLKAYQQVKGLVAGVGGSGFPGVPRSILEKIWSFPFFYPLPTNIPGLSPADKESIEKFQNSSGLDGKYSTAIESESAKYNLNMILAPFAPKPSPSPSPSAVPRGDEKEAKLETPAFNPEDARSTLTDYLASILNNKIASDPTFASEYRDFRLEDLMDNIFAWADRTYERRSSKQDDIREKKAPFYSLSELHMIPPMDDELYELFSDSLTVSTTPGINVNTMKEPTLKALLPRITDEEAQDFFKYRDSADEDNFFKNEEDFFKYLQANITSIFHNDPAEIERFRKDLQKRNIRIVVDETEFKITVNAQVNQSVRTIEAWVTLESVSSVKTQSTSKPSVPGQPPPLSGPGMQPSPDSGLRITFMKLL